MNKESDAIKNGRIFKHNQKEEPTINKTFWYVWYRKGKTSRLNKEEPRILYQTCSTTKESAEEQKEKLKNSNILNGCEIGIVSIEGKFSNFQYIRDLSIKDKNILSCLDVGKFIVVDTETTGLSKWDQVIDLAAVKVLDYKVVDTFQCYIIPTKSIGYDSQKIHGLSTSFLKEYGIPAKEAFEKFREFIKNGGDFVGHNISFDKRMIEAHSSKVDVPIKIPICFDTQKMSEKLIHLPDYKLSNIVDIFNLRGNLKSHSALDDVLGTFKVSCILNSIYKKL